MSSFSSLSGQDLGCIRGDLPLFSGVYFHLSSAQCLQVTGSNGFGKSSLLRMIAGLLPVSAGKLSWGEVPPHMHKCLLVNHKQGLKPYMTVAETVQYWGQLAQRSVSEIAHILEDWQLNPFNDFLTSSLSQGQRQRVNLCRLSIFDVWVWLLDEPFSALDCLSQEILCKRIQLHLKKGGCVIFTSHNSHTRRQERETTHILNLESYCCLGKL